MSDQVGEQDQKAGEQEQSVDVNELVSRLDKLESYNAKLLDEAKTTNRKYKQFRADVEEKEKTQMQENNDFKGLYERAIEESSELKQKIQEKERVSVKNSFKYEAAKHAPDTIDPDLLIAALNTKKETIAYDHDASLWKGVDQAINELRSEKPFLFREEKVGMSNGRPQAVLNKEKTFEEQFKDDPDSIWENALKNGGLL
jgi:predicted nuclease with TOPRIM domain